MRIELVTPVVSMIGTVVAAIIVAVIGWQTSTLQDKQEAAFAKQEAALALAAQSHEVKKPYLVKQLDLYLEAVRVASAIAVSPHGEERDTNERRFWELYWGELAVVEDQVVVDAMVAFGNTLSAGSEGEDRLRSRSIGLAHACRDSLKNRWGVDLGPLTDSRSVK